MSTIRRDRFSEIMLNIKIEGHQRYGDLIVEQPIIERFDTSFDEFIRIRDIAFTASCTHDRR